MSNSQVPNLLPVYKFTDRKMRTYGDFQWEIQIPRNISYVAACPRLCSPDVFHWHYSPLLAVMHDPITGGYLRKWGVRLYRAEAAGDIVRDDGMFKGGSTSLTLEYRVPIPKVSHQQWVRYWLLLVQAVAPDYVYVVPEWAQWVDGWISGKDCSRKGARKALKSSVGYGNLATCLCRLALGQGLFRRMDREALNQIHWKLEGYHTTYLLDLQKIADQAMLVK